MQPLNKQLFINLSVDSPDKKHFDVPADSLGSLWIIEDLSQLVPVCSFRYAETYSEFSELFPLLGNETLNIELGLNKDKYRRFQFKYSSYETRSLGAILSRNKQIMVNWIDADFPKLRQYPKIMHFTQAAASDIARIISDGLPLEVESTKGINDYFINNRVIGEALKDLAAGSYSADGSSFMFFKNNDKYYFKSRNSIMRQNTKASFIHGYDLTQFSLFGNDRSLFTNPLSEVIGYSYEKGENFTFNKTPEDVKAKKASFGKNMPFGQGTEITSGSLYDGTRHTHEAEALAIANTESYMDSAQRIVFVALGQPFVSCGDVIEISIAPSFREFGKQNMQISGKWFVEKVVHYIAKYNYSMKVFASKANIDYTRRKAVL